MKFNKKQRKWGSHFSKKWDFFKSYFIGSVMCLFGGGIFWEASAHNQSRVDLIRKKGLIEAGFSYKIKGFSLPDAKGHWEGIDIDFLRAISLALFGDKRHIRIIQITPYEQFEALSSGKIDILATSLPKNFYQKIIPQVTFIPPLFFDTNAFVVPASLHIQSPLEINGFNVCVADVPELLEGMVTFFDSNKLPVISHISATLYGASDMYLKGKCEAFFARRSQLLGFLDKLLDQGSVNKFLDLSFPISELSPCVMSRDIEWIHLLLCVRNALILAEELGITSENIERQKVEGTQAYVDFLRSTNQWASPLNLSSEWAYIMILGIGNYRQIYRRNFNGFQQWHMIEGLNRLVEEGGRISQDWPLSKG